MVATPPQTDTYSTALDIFDRTHPLRVDVDENLKVTIAGTFPPITGTVTALQGTSPWVIAGTVSLTSGSIEIGTVDQGTPGAFPWLVVVPPSATAVTTSVVVTTTPTTLLAANPSRKGFMVQNTSATVFIKLDTTSSTILYSCELPRKGIFEKDNYSGPVTAVTASGSVTVLVTELV